MTPAAERSPERPPPPAELAPFLGAWQHPRLRLVLELGPEAALTGELELGGRAFPARGERVGAGVEGAFRAAERELPFRLVQRPGGLTLTCDGRDYELQRAAPHAAADPFVGSYQGPLPDTPDAKPADAPSLELVSKQRGYAGVLVLEGIRYALLGQAHEVEGGQELRGSLRDPLSGRSLGFSLSRVEGQLLLTVRFEGEEKRVSYETLVFRPR